MVRAWPGQVPRTQSSPSTPSPVSSRPSASTSTGCTPGSGRVAEPGLSGVTPGIGLIMAPPVSVCHQVSTTGQRPCPTSSWYQRQTSGLIGSPTVPSRRRLARLLPFSGSEPSRIRARSAVGAV